MASHWNTPPSVLEAPQRSYIRAVPQDGRNRSNRRHFRPSVEGSTEMPPLMRIKPMLPATMEPAVKSVHKDPRRNLDGTRKARRG